MSNSEPTDDQLIDQHDANVRKVAESVAGLVQKFAPHGMTPVAVFEGAIRGAALSMILHQGDTPQEVADMLDTFAAGFRALPAEAFKPAAN